MQVTQAAINLTIGPFTFHQFNRPPSIRNDKVYFSTVRVAKVVQIQLIALGILSVMDPFQ